MASLCEALSSVQSADCFAVGHGEIEIERNSNDDLYLTASGEPVGVPITQDQIMMMASISKFQESRDHSSHFISHASWATLDQSPLKLQGPGRCYGI